MGSSIGADGSKPSKRVITDTRREQNRLAQVKYRKRQKEKRLQKGSRDYDRIPKSKLELRPKQTNRPETAPSGDVHSSNGNNAIKLRSSRDKALLDTTLHTIPSLLPADTSLSTTYQNRIYVTDNPILYPLPILSSSTFFPSIDYSCQNDTVNSGLYFMAEVPDVDHFESNLSLADVPNEAFDVPERDEISKSALGPLGQLEFPAPITSDSLSVERGRGGVFPESALSATASIPHARRQTILHNDPSTWDATMPPAAKSIGLEEIIAAGMQVLLFNRASPPSKSTELTMASFSLPSPYTNVLNTRRTRTLTACIHNARRMGFQTSDVIKPHCIAPSLFYRPHSPGDDYEALVASATNPNTPAHLQPTLAQVLYQHPAFLDLIPVPGFRSKVILAAVRKGWGMGGMGSLDLFDLKRDMFQDGLVWRSYDGYDEQGANGEPWDMRSWEASGWFATKWRGLVDDDVHVIPDT